jgi:large subunit ribosomal protein L24
MRRGFTMERLKQNDIVEVISGESKGKQGKLIRFSSDKARAFVEKINMIKRHTKASQKNPTGGIVEKEGSIHVSNLMYVDPQTKKPTKIGFKILKDNKRVRIAKESGSELK